VCESGSWGGWGGSGGTNAEIEAWERVLKLDRLSDDEPSASAASLFKIDFNLSERDFAATIFDSRRKASTPDLFARVDVAFASLTSFSSFDEADRMPAASPAPFALLADCMTFSRPVTMARMSLGVVIANGQKRKNTTSEFGGRKY